MRSVSKRRLKKKREGAYNLLGCGSLWVMYGTYVCTGMRMGRCDRKEWSI
jgi:hypothetical protein